MFEVIDSLNIRGIGVQEDRIGWGRDWAFVLDGATGLGNHNIMNDESDAAWFTEEAGHYLRSALDDQDLDLGTILSNTAAKLKSEYDRNWTARGKTDPPDYPSAGIAVIRIRNGVLEYIGLGDCSTVIGFRDGTAVELTDSAVPKLDQEVIDIMKRISSESGCSILEARTQVEDLLRQNRNLRNRKGGYWIFDPSGEGVPHATSLSWPKKDVSSFSLMSDGFSELCEPFHVVENLTELHGKLVKGEMADLSARLFREQRRDEECNRFPRFKYRDDTSVLVARIVH